MHTTETTTADPLHGQTLAQAASGKGTAIPAELITLPYQVHPLTCADRAEASGPEYVTGYLTAEEDDRPNYFAAELARFRAALPSGWRASWLSANPGDTRIVVRQADPAALPDPVTEALAMLPPGCSHVCGGYSVRPRPCGGPSTGRYGASVYGDAVEAELVALSTERGRGETLAVDGDLWGGAQVVIAHPRQADHGFYAVDLGPLGDRYPALLAACAVRTPDDVDEPRYSLATGGGTIAPRVLDGRRSMTADEIRAWARTQRAKGLLGDRGRAALVASVESALAAGGGRGGAGCFTVGTAAGQPIVSFEIRPAP